MTKVAILPTPIGNEDIAFTAVAGKKRSKGATAGEALDALTAQLSQDDINTLIIIRTQKPDAFFDAAQQQRMAELMDRWRIARDQGQALSRAEQVELEALVEAELLASGARAEALADESGK